MRHLLAPLIWKELRERRLFLVLGLVWMLLGTFWLLGYELTHRLRGPVASFHTTASVFGLLAGVLAAMRTARGETTDRTRGFSDSLPIPPPLRAAVRLAGGILVLAVPISVAALVLSLGLGTGIVEQAYPTARYYDADYLPMLERASLPRLAAFGFAWYVALMEIASASWFLLLATALGTVTRSESRAGYAAAALAAVTILLGSGREMFKADHPGAAAAMSVLVPASRTIIWGYGGPEGSWGDIDLGRGLGWTLPVSLLLQSLFAVWLVRRMSRLTDRRFEVEEGAAPSRVWIPRWLPLPTRGVALAWLAVRHALPMAIPGFVFAAAITLPQWIPRIPTVEIVDGQAIVMQPSGEGSPLFGDMLSQSNWFLAAIWGIVVGAGLFASEADSRVGEFWRTRPIGATGLFAVKFLVGLMVTLLVLDGPPIALAWDSPFWGDYYAMNWPHVATMVPLHATLFAVAVACTCLTRHAAIGGVLTFVLLIGASFVTTAVPALDPVDTYNNSRFTDRGMDPTGPEGPPEMMILPPGAVVPPGTALPPGVMLAEDVSLGMRIRNIVRLLPPTYPLVAGAMGLITLVSLGVGLWSLKRYRPVVAVA